MTEGDPVGGRGPAGKEPELGCCDAVSGDLDQGALGRCPLSGSKGQQVPWLTVAALVVGPVPPRQTLWLCREPSCPIVYFGDRGARFERDALRVDPGFKLGSPGLLCYCFSYRRSELEDEAERTGTSAILDAVTARVQARECACEVRNPSGRCCLGTLRRHVQIALERRSDR